jgi:hypothetical protein
MVPAAADAEPQAAAAQEIYFGCLLRDEPGLPLRRDEAYDLFTAGQPGSGIQCQQSGTPSTHAPSVGSKPGQ